MNEIERRLFLIKESINKACKLYQRKANDVNLIAVSKTVAADQIISAIDAGCKEFGENYIQEAQQKWRDLKENYPQTKLHFIGHLQSNKAEDAVELFDVIQTVDSQKLVLAIKKAAQKLQKSPEIFIQVNIGEEQQKSGVMLNEVKDLVNFVRQCELNLAGLMCIPPSDEAASPYFALLKKIANENNLTQISCGMSADFEQAIAVGSNHVRLGTAIFGARS